MAGIADGKPFLDFLHPCLYQRLYKAFTDVTGGSASGCDSTGFPAQAGWDAVTGSGTPVSVPISMMMLLLILNAVLSQRQCCIDNVGILCSN